MARSKFVLQQGQIFDNTDQIVHNTDQIVQNTDQIFHNTDQIATNVKRKTCITTRTNFP